MCARMEEDGAARRKIHAAQKFNEPDYKWSWFMQQRTEVPSVECLRVALCFNVKLIFNNIFQEEEQK